MSDEQDRTGAFGSGRADDGNHPRGGPRSGDVPAADRTRPPPRMPAGNDPAGTQPMPRLPATDDPTVVTPRPERWDSTSVLPRGADAWADDGAEPVWAGRAAVRTPRPDGRDPVGPADADLGAEPAGRWWMPIVVGLAALVLLALLGWAVWLIVRAAGPDDETPAPRATASAPVLRATRLASAPVVAPTVPATPASAPAAAPEEPATVVLPALKGLSRQEAEQALGRRGLNYRVIFRAGPGAAGTVLDSDPTEGQEVPAETQVTLVIATARPTASPTPATPASTGPSAGNQD